MDVTVCGDGCKEEEQCVYKLTRMGGVGGRVGACARGGLRLLAC